LKINVALSNSGSSLMRPILVALLRDERGVTAIEYGLIAALIAVACVVVWGQVGTDLSTNIQHHRRRSLNIA
jgi:pilus assembly protein Flp/PilA